MKVRYRIIEKRWPGGDAWERWGAIYDNRSEHFRGSKSLLMSSLAENEKVVREFEQRVAALELDVEHCRPLLEGHTRQFRFAPEVKVMHGETFRAIHEALWQRIFGLSERERQPGQGQIQPEYVPLPAHHALRESDEADDA